MNFWEMRKKLIIRANVYYDSIVSHCWGHSITYILRKIVTKLSSVDSFDYVCFVFSIQKSNFIQKYDLVLEKQWCGLKNISKTVDILA